MNTLELSSDEFMNLRKFALIEGILEKESDLYYVPNSEEEVIKIYKNYDNPLYIAEKILTINNLFKYVNELDFPELLVPSGVLLVDGKFRGPIYPILDGYTSRIYLRSSYCPIDMKIEILRKIGTLLEKIKNTNPKYNAAFSDPHIDNFMVMGYPSYNIANSPDFKIMACDTDSMKILDSPGITGYYLYDSDKLGDFSKYPLDKDGFVLANSDTDIYCYSMMILDLISNSEYVYCLNIDEYYRYLDYLDKLGFDSNLLKAFASLYEDDKNNISPLPYIDNISKMGSESSLTTFYKTRIKK